MQRRTKECGKMSILSHILHTPLSGSLSKCISTSWNHTVYQILTGWVKCVNESEDQYGFQPLKPYTDLLKWSMTLPDASKDTVGLTMKKAFVLNRKYHCPEYVYEKCE